MYYILYNIHYILYIIYYEFFAGEALYTRTMVEANLECTILHLHNRMRWLLHVLKWYVLEIHTYMGAFGASSPKPSRLFGTPCWMGELIQKIKKGTKFSNKKVSVRYYNKKGKRSVTGGPGLKQTQQYPEGYCRKVCQLYLKHRASNKLTIRLDKLEKIPKKKDLWRDVKLKSLLLSLQGAGYFPGCN